MLTTATVETTSGNVVSDEGARTYSIVDKAVTAIVSGAFAEILGLKRCYFCGIMYRYRYGSFYNGKIHKG